MVSVGQSDAPGFLKHIWWSMVIATQINYYYSLPGADFLKHIRWSMVIAAQILPGAHFLKHIRWSMVIVGQSDAPGFLKHIRWSMVIAAQINYYYTLLRADFLKHISWSMVFLNQNNYYFPVLGAAATPSICEQILLRKSYFSPTCEGGYFLAARFQNVSKNSPSPHPG